MNDKLLQEQLERVGLATHHDLVEQTGAAHTLLQNTTLHLLEKREVFLCRLDHGQETLVSRHLLYCLQSVRWDPVLSEEAQALYDWLSEHEDASTLDMRDTSGLSHKAFWKAMRELEESMCIAPVRVLWENVSGAVDREADLMDVFPLLWETQEKWTRELPRPSRYRDLEYSLSELKQVLQGHFSTREIDRFLYHQP